MSFFVAVEQRVPPARLDHILAAIRSDFDGSHRAHPGRIHARIFQSLGDPCHLLSVGEWEARADFERLLQDPHFRAATVLADPPASIDYLARLRLFTRLSHRPAVVACALITGPAGTADALTAFVLNRSRCDIEPVEGLVSHELYRLEGSGGRLLAVHGWRSLESLQRFRDEHIAAFDADLADRGASMERFIGELATEYLRPLGSTHDWGKIVC